ncbi:MAG: hypothetical protein S4CHLAM102_13890 [Chlamydiia bacterium]|nr:hypothetical protein [Chlamydiia bacterium]
MDGYAAYTKWRAASHAAPWEKIPKTERGTLLVESFDDMASIIEVHNAAIEMLGKPELSWENTVGARTAVKD